jgi:hypothetical protein
VQGGPGQGLGVQVHLCDTGYQRGGPQAGKQKHGVKKEEHQREKKKHKQIAVLLCFF